ncbi:MAG: DUF5317 domain-containing protein [Acidimicrobiia bacterium]|nr:DUF5317 domain-containing protein [Acidimicrobiia bacterium]
MALLGVVLGVAVAIALVRGGRISNLARIELLAWPLLFLAAAIQLGAELLPDDRPWSRWGGVSLILGSYALLLIVILINRDRSGLWLAGLGILLNFLVIGLNSGMPVSAEAAALAGSGEAELVFDAKHVALDAESRLAFLADVIPVRAIGQVLSIGDVLLAVGLGRFLEAELRTRHWLRDAGAGKPGSAAGQ